MFFLPRVSTMILAAALVASPALATSKHSVPTNGHAHASLTHRAGKAVRGHLHRASKPVGQRGIAPERATEIQSALIHENYMSGAPTGQWDAQTEAAMQKFQSDNGWQTKLIPDSRAIIKLGLGPHQDSESSFASPTNASSLSSSNAEFMQR
jgi:peptidoglycan hydrolase-like protein with peptidoglycan-binding domain